MGHLLDQRHRPDDVAKGTDMNQNTIAVEHPTDPKRLMRIDRAVYDADPDAYTEWDGDAPGAPAPPDPYNDRAKELKVMSADDVRDICNAIGITYTNKPDAIDDILAAEFDDADE